MTFGRRDDRTSVFCALRPGLGQTVSRAVLTTYSLDLIAMLGLVLALGGDAETEFEVSPLGLVKAFDRVRGQAHRSSPAGPRRGTERAQGGPPATRHDGARSRLERAPGKLAP